MKQLDVVRKMEGAFGGRTLRCHAGERGVVRFGASDSMTAIVLDLSVSREILLSKSFGSFNYFDAGYRRFADSKYTLEVVRDFFQAGPIFLEGEQHRAARRLFNNLLDEQMALLESIAPAIRAAMNKRKHRFNTALDFSRLFVEICLATMINNLLAMPLKVALRALRARRNVFYFHFHPLRHADANKALAMLENKSSIADHSLKDDIRRLVCCSLITMAYDPLIATISANLAQRRTRGFDTSTEEFCPVSFVSRKCLHSVEIGSVSFARGDVCYVSLLPAATEKRANTFPFGAGAHVCIGKKISLQILQLAEQIVTADFAEGFPDPPVLAPDGAFLSFRN